MKNTALTSWHTAHHAKMIPFFGTLLPVHYAKGIIAEHEAVRAHAGIFDVSHMGQLFFSGQDAFAQANTILSMDIEAMHVGQVKYGFILRSNGTVVDDVLCMKTCEDEVLVIVNGANIDKVMHFLDHTFAQQALVNNSSDHYSVIAFQGPLTQALILNVIEQPLDFFTFRFGHFLGVPMFVSRTGYTGEHGYELIVANKDAQYVWESLITLDERVTPCGLGARDSLRLEAGFPLYGHELNDDLTPLDVNLGFFVPKHRRHAFNLTNYTPSKKRIGFFLPEKVIPREGYTLVQDGIVVGKVSSGTFSPTLKRGIAMAILNADADIQREITCIVRAKAYPIEVITLPFVKK